MVYLANSGIYLAKMGIYLETNGGSMEIQPWLYSRHFDTDNYEGLWVWQKDWKGFVQEKKGIEMEVETRLGCALGYFDMCGSFMGLHRYWKGLAIKQVKIYCKTARKQEQKQFQLTKSLVKSRDMI